VPTLRRKDDVLDNAAQQIASQFDDVVGPSNSRPGSLDWQLAAPLSS
jgi:hypothetical protein